MSLSPLINPSPLGGFASLKLHVRRYGLKGVLINWTEDGSQSRRDDTDIAWGGDLVVLHIFSEPHCPKSKPEASQLLAGGYASLPGTVFRDSGTLVPGNERHHRTETVEYIIPEGWQPRHIAGIPPGCNLHSSLSPVVSLRSTTG